MCGRINQDEDIAPYLLTLDWSALWTPQPGTYLKPNIPPGTTPLALHQLGGSMAVDPLFWGYKPVWSHRRAVSDARIDTILDGSRFWKPLLGRRIVVPASGWYEWTGPKGDSQPWYISARNGRPVLMAAICAWSPGKEPSEQTGFAIVTDGTAGGMVDLHDRRPVCLTPDDARAWLDPRTPIPEALELLSTPRPESAFQWWEVTRRMGNSRYQGADCAEPIKM